MKDILQYTKENVKTIVLKTSQKPSYAVALILFWSHSKYNWTYNFFLALVLYEGYLFVLGWPEPK